MQKPKVIDSTQAPKMCMVTEWGEPLGDKCPLVKLNLCRCWLEVDSFTMPRVYYQAIWDPRLQRSWCAIKKKTLQFGTRADTAPVQIAAQRLGEASQPDAAFELQGGLFDDPLPSPQSCLSCDRYARQGFFLASAALRMQPRWARLYYMSAALSSQEIREEEREA